MNKFVAWNSQNRKLTVRQCCGIYKKILGGNGK